jgi:hypothetical protein
VVGLRLYLSFLHFLRFVSTFFRSSLEVIDDDSLRFSQHPPTRHPRRHLTSLRVSVHGTPHGTHHQGRQLAGQAREGEGEGFRDLAGATA